MKNFISKLAIAIILSFTLVAVNKISPVVSAKSMPLRSARISQTQSGPVIPGSSYSEVMNILFVGSGR